MCQERKAAESSRCIFVSLSAVLVVCHDVECMFFFNVSLNVCNVIVQTVYYPALKDFPPQVCRTAEQSKAMSLSPTMTLLKIAQGTSYSKNFMQSLFSAQSIVLQNATKATREICNLISY